MKELNFRAKDLSMLIDFLKIFEVVDSNLLLEINPDLTAVVKSYTVARTAVKYNIINLCECFELTDNKQCPTEKIKIGLYHVKNFLNILKKFITVDNTYIIFNYEANNEGEFVAKTIILQSTDRTVIHGCAQLGLFKYMPDDVINQVFDTSSSYLEFKLSSKVLKSVIEDSKDEACTDVYIKTAKIDDSSYIIFEGKNYSTRYKTEIKFIKELNYNCLITKEYLKYLDKNEDYTVFITESSVIFNSLLSNTKISFGRCNYEEEEVEC
ncbi:MAG: hypothetical protein EPN82_14400 [Bacteroidetes bacterium]|nr:MAG: hypothetical protein EPN82_14400 [Bacteroidota bacterium]